MGMKEMMLEYYQHPNQKFCFYSGEANQEFAKAAGVSIWDWTPEKALVSDPLWGYTHTIPLAMGCEKSFTSEGKEWIAPRIKSVEDIKAIEVPPVRHGRTGEILDEVERMMEKNPDSIIRFPDIQSPLGVAELMWDESFYLSLISYPEEVHQLLEKITVFTIAYIKELQKVMGDKSNPCCFPYIWSDAPGYYIADDTNSMVSPEMHLEYSVNYINRITDAVGPVHYHSCTWLSPYYENIGKIRNAKARNWSIIVSADPAEIIREFSGKAFLAPHIHLNMHKERGITDLPVKLNSEYEVVKYIIDNMQNNTSLYLQFYDDLVQETDKMLEIYHLLDSRGYTPKANGFA